MKFRVSWIDAGGCDIHDMEVEAASPFSALSPGLYTLAREDMDKYEEVSSDATKVIIEVI